MATKNIPTIQDLQQITLRLNTNPDSRLSEELYEFYKGKFSHGGIRINEDRRFADFIFLLPHMTKNDRALIIGGGKGLFPIWLADYFEKVTVIDTRTEIVGFLRAIASNENKNNLSALTVSPGNNLITTLAKHQENYDCIIFTQYLTSAKQEFVEICKHLNSDGHLIIFAENPLSWEHFVLKAKTVAKKPAYAKSVYLKLLKAAGFANTTVYAPLPFHDSNPLFYLPITDGKSNKVAKYFLKNIFCLFDMVSPEIKNKYAFELFISRFLAKISVYLNLTNFLMNFTSGYILIAKKSS